MKIQKNENGKGKRQLGVKWDSYGAVGGSQSHWYLCDLGLELHEVLVFGIEGLWKLGRKKVKDPFSSMAFYDLPWYGTFPNKAYNPITWR